MAKRFTTRRLFLAIGYCGLACLCLRIAASYWSPNFGLRFSQPSGAWGAIAAIVGGGFVGAMIGTLAFPDFDWVWMIACAAVVAFTLLFIPF